MPSRAVEGDDWSSVIDGQTAETLVQGGNPAEDSSQHPIATPFARASVHRSIGEPSTYSSFPLPCLRVSSCAGARQSAR